MEENERVGDFATQALMELDYDVRLATDAATTLGPDLLDFVIAQIAFATMPGTITEATQAMPGEIFRSRYRLSD